MSMLPSPASCGEECPSVANVAVPGSPGNDGEAGAAGADGLNAYTRTTAQFTMPDEGDSVALPVLSSAFAVIGQPLFVQVAGTMRVIAIPDDLTLTVANIADSGIGAYPGNAAGGVIIPTSQRVCPSGFQGEAGTSAGLALLISENLGDLDDPSAARSNLGLGSCAQLGAGDVLQVANDLVDLNDPAVARTSLGLGTIAVQADDAVNIDGGTIDDTIIGSGTKAAGSFTDLTSTGAVLSQGSVTVEGATFLAAASAQSLIAATTINPNRTKIKVVGNGGPVTLVSHPTITAPASDGQLLIIQGTDDTNTVELQDDGASSGTKLQLGSTSRVLGKGDILGLMWDQTDGFWYELFTANN